MHSFAPTYWTNQKVLLHLLTYILPSLETAAAKSRICYVTKDTAQSMSSVRAVTRSPFSHDWLHQRQVLWKQNTNRSGGPRPHMKAGALCSRSMLEAKTPNPSLPLWLPGRIKAIAEHQQEYTGRAFIAGKWPGASQALRELHLQGTLAASQQGHVEAPRVVTCRASLEIWLYTGIAPSIYCLVPQDLGRWS